ncbi:WYL domain-containing protein [Oscillatoria sp. FACHB-1406]|uniref:helix-turn-helix transcriptional regulator n=1 Tax=Oscillatoria sp. FACHB-1406 TaxID=2692846 RepID=UPI001688537C|nr:WYL domain-containing protein [Oscillatoria sp. FACHB-1406]MBD2578456.1 WYL domain-containing protein [Oscillatoria sp. FACHB-1406]
MPRKKETITLSIPPGTKEKLEAIAARLGIYWGKSPSISGLLAAIAQEEVEVGKPFTLNHSQVKALRQAIANSIDAGHIESAQILMLLLLDRGNLEAPLRQSLLQQVGQPIEAWRIRVNQLIEAKQPFHLSYRNSQEQTLEYTVRCAKVIQYEKRTYLQVWCEETEDSTDLPELRHNRCLRFDRILSMIPLTGEWREQLDSIKVYLHFRGWLVRAYEPKPDDIENEVIGEVRQVIRKVSNPFWLIREVIRYGKDCEIVAPPAMRDRFIGELKTLCQRYNLDLRPETPDD